MKTINIKKDEDSDECYFDISDFGEYYDVDKIKSYQFDRLENGDIAITFYDKNGEILKSKV
jgi:hypothetical protein